MRTEQAFKNVVMSLLLQIVLAVSGIIVPRFFISLYGTNINGLVSSISQFITYMGLVEAGIGAAGTVALYNPLAKKDNKRINGIISASRIFYIRSGIFFIGLLFLLVLIYPSFLQDQIYDVGFIRAMIIVLSINGIVDYFYLGKYRVLLHADQRGYVISTFQIAGTIVMSYVCILMMTFECSALWVKGVAAVIYLLRSLAIGHYVRRNYPQADFKALPIYSALDRHWSALFHQIVGMIVNNTAIILMTLLFAKNALLEISVYSVYNMVAYALISLMSAISNGLGSGFGDVISKNETDILKLSFSNYEYVFFTIIFITVSCLASLLYPFIGLYSSSFADSVLYLRWPLVVLFTLTVFLQSLRLPGLTIICAAGHYKQTQGRAIVEALINITVSLLLISHLGMVGILIGMCTSFLYRTADVIIYSAKNFTKGSLKTTVNRLTRNTITMIILISLGIYFIPSSMTNWIQLIVFALIFGSVCLVSFIGINAFYEPNEFKSLLNKISSIIHKI